MSVAITCWECDADGRRSHVMSFGAFTIEMPEPGVEPGIVLRARCPVGHLYVQHVARADKPKAVEVLSTHPDVRVAGLASDFTAIAAWLAPRADGAAGSELC